MGNPEMYIDLAPEFTDSGTPVIKFTNDEDANELLANDPNALLIAIVLDQQISSTKAFSGPRDLKQRLGHLDPAQIAEMDEDEFLTVFREKPAIHRFPASMGKRVQAACAMVRDEYRQQRRQHLGQPAGCEDDHEASGRRARRRSGEAEDRDPVAGSVLRDGYSRLAGCDSGRVAGLAVSQRRRHCRACPRIKCGAGCGNLAVGYTNVRGEHGEIPAASAGMAEFYERYPPLTACAAVEAAASEGGF